MTTEEKWYPPRDIWLGNEQGCPPFDVSNQMLYNAVKSNPSNLDAPQIIGKLMLIGRTYSAAVERRRTSNAVQDNRQGLEVIIEAACAIANSNVESQMALVGKTERLSRERITDAVELHSAVCAALRKANQRSNSSLASKYLHFHRPAFFPIVDSYVREGWWWIMDSLGEKNEGWSVFGQVERYGNWCERVLSLQQKLERHLRKPVSLRQIDNYMLSIMSLDGLGGVGLPLLPG